MKQFFFIVLCYSLFRNKIDIYILSETRHIFYIDFQKSHVCFLLFTVFLFLYIVLCHIV